MKPAIPFELSRGGPPKHFTVIDPDRQPPEAAGKMAALAQSLGSDAILIGGSTVSATEVDETTAAIRRVCSLPLILFPNGASALSRHADHILWMMLMNSRNRRFLVGEQVKAAPYLRKLEINPVSTGYIVISTSATPTTVERVGEVEPIAPGDIKTAVAYALTAQYYGMKHVFLDAGSGADAPVPLEMVKAVRQEVDLPLIVAGGLKDEATVVGAVEAGADAVVTGTIVEQTPERLAGIITAIKRAGANR